MTTPAPIRAQIRQALTTAGLTQTALAQAAAVPRPNLNDYLAGRADITTESADRLLAALAQAATAATATPKPTHDNSIRTTHAPAPPPQKRGHPTPPSTPRKST